MFLLMSTMLSGSAADLRNLLVNPDFDFHAFMNHRAGERNSHTAHQVACWNTDSPLDVTVTRSSHVPASVLSDCFVRNAVKIEPGKRFYQFFTLPEARLIANQKISLNFWATVGIKGVVKQMAFDREDGEWSPQQFGMADKRTFPKCSRGELIVATMADVTAPNTAAKSQNISIEDIAIQENVAGIEVEFINVGTEPAWVFLPSLIRGIKAETAVGMLRETPTAYRHIPRTIQKLWKGEGVHIVIMGSSIDRGSANPPLYVYNEDPKSPEFKTPLCDAYNGKFSAAMVGQPDLDLYLAQPRHYFSYGGRLKRSLMNKFNLDAGRILLNFMAADGSCIGESHSGLREWLDLENPPNPELNGHKTGKSWRELYPALFERREGARPDLVIFGSGANEKTDTPDEVAVFEGAIRWIQRNYPETEFVFCLFQNQGGYTSNQGDLQALALRYQIPFMDYGIIGDLVTRSVDKLSVVPRDGHPQAGAHYLWFKQLEKAFECHDPISTGQVQLQLPERVHPNSYGWEGEMVKYKAGNARFFRKNAVIIDDAAFNCWGSFKGKDSAIFVDGKNVGQGRRSFPTINPRNSLFAHGRQSFTERHVVELVAEDAKFSGIDCKICPGRNFIGVESATWNSDNFNLKIEDYQSAVGAPYGDKIAELPAGKSLTITAAGTDFSIAWLDQTDGGNLKFEVGDKGFEQATNLPFKLQSGESLFMENRRGVNGLPYGTYKLTITAVDKPITLFGLFAYDARSAKEAMAFGK